MKHFSPNTLFSKRYKLIKLLGIGGYSEVWLAADTIAGNIEVALKIYSPEKGLDEKGIETFSREYALVFNLSHPNLLKPMHFDVWGGSPYLVLQYCRKGSTFNLLGEFNEGEIAKLLKQIASALAYLHRQEPPIIHQDVKPDNILKDDEGNYLLADFGISSKIRRTLTRSMGKRESFGTMAYMPPERWGKENDPILAWDVFSLGVTAFELIKGDLPFGDSGGLALKAGAEVPDIPKGFSSGLNKLIENCLDREPWKRPTAQAIENIASKYVSESVWELKGLPVLSETKPVVEKPRRKTKDISSLPVTSLSSESPKNDLPPKDTNDTDEPLHDYTPIALSIVIIIIVIGLIIIMSIQGGRNNPSALERAEQARLDSIHVADSIVNEMRIQDSIRIADSIAQAETDTEMIDPVR